MLFLLIRFPAILQDSRRLQLLLSAVDGGPPCFKSLHSHGLAGGKPKPTNKPTKQTQQKNRTQKKQTKKIRTNSETRLLATPMLSPDPKILLLTQKNVLLSSRAFLESLWCPPSQVSRFLSEGYALHIRSKRKSLLWKSHLLRAGSYKADDTPI